MLYYVIQDVFIEKTLQPELSYIIRTEKVNYIPNRSYIPCQKKRQRKRATRRR